MHHVHHYGPGVSIASLFLRFALGIPMLLHGYRHMFGGGKLAGTGRWFESLGMKPGWLHARFATYTELAVAPMLFLGLLTPLAAAGVIGVMLVALITNHLKNGYFIFNPGEGYEYVLFITMTAFGLGAVGGGRISLDHAIGWHLHGFLEGRRGFLVTLLGVVGAAALLAVFWRPEKKPAATE